MRLSPGQPLSYEFNNFLHSHVDAACDLCRVKPTNHLCECHSETLLLHIIANALLRHRKSGVREVVLWPQRELLCEIDVEELTAYRQSPSNVISGGIHAARCVRIRCSTVELCQSTIFVVRRVCPPLMEPFEHAEGTPVSSWRLTTSITGLPPVTLTSDSTRPATPVHCFCSPVIVRELRPAPQIVACTRDIRLCQRCTESSVRHRAVEQPVPSRTAIVPFRAVFPPSARSTCD